MCIRGTHMIALHARSRVEEDGKRHISFHKFACVSVPVKEKEQRLQSAVCILFLIK